MPMPDSKQPYRSDIQLRFNDTDALGHLNNSSFFLYAELARIEFFGAIGSSVDGLILAHISLDFRRQVVFGEEVYVLTEVEKLGNSSISLKQQVIAKGKLAAEIASVIVLFDYQTQKPTRIPDELRDRLLSPVSSG